MIDLAGAGAGAGVRHLAGAGAGVRHFWPGPGPGLRPGIYILKTVDQNHICYFQKDRVKILPRNVETLLFLKYNLRAISYKTTLPNIPEGFMAPNAKQYDASEAEPTVDSDSDESDVNC